MSMKNAEWSKQVRRIVGLCTSRVRALAFGKPFTYHLGGSTIMSINCWQLFLGLLCLNSVSLSSAAWSLFFHVDLLPTTFQFPLNELQRYRRQVVTPDWLMGPINVPNSQDAEVRVTPQNRQEAAAIRASIQKAVNEGRYVVGTDPKQIILNQLGYTNQWPLTSMPAPIWLPPFQLGNLWSSVGQRRQLQQQQGKAN